MAEQQPGNGFVDAPELKAGDKAISFCCATCGQEIVAPEETIGMEAECPACGAKLTIPDNRSDGIERYAAGEADPDHVQAMKSRTIRIELGTDL